MGRLGEAVYCPSNEWWEINDNVVAVATGTVVLDDGKKLNVPSFPGRPLSLVQESTQLGHCGLCLVLWLVLVLRSWLSALSVSSLLEFLDSDVYFAHFLLLCCKSWSMLLVRKGRNTSWLKKMGVAGICRRSRHGGCQNLLAVQGTKITQSLHSYTYVEWIVLWKCLWWNCKISSLDRLSRRYL